MEGITDTEYHWHLMEAQVILDGMGAVKYGATCSDDQDNAIQGLLVKIRRKKRNPLMHEVFINTYGIKI